jgi:hypothetical protein
LFTVAIDGGAKEQLRLESLLGCQTMDLIGINPIIFDFVVSSHQKLVAGLSTSGPIRPRVHLAGGFELRGC